MNVSFHVDFMKDLEGAIEIALGIIPDKRLKRFITLDNRKRFLDTLNENRFDYDKVKFPLSIDIKYKPIFESNKKILLKAKGEIEKKWSGIENKFFGKLDKIFGKTQENLRIRCYIIYSYENVAGVSNDKLYFKVGYKVSDIQTIAHEIIHIYLNRFQKSSINYLKLS